MDSVAQRQAAEARFNGRSESLPPQTEIELRRTSHELAVHQIELEMQNEELSAAHADIAAALERYTDLFDSAPVGYFNLAADGTILLVNLAGAKLVGLERGRLLGRRLGLFLAEESRRPFSEFLARAFATEGRSACELKLGVAPDPILSVLLEATLSPEAEECRVVVVDVTERKLLEDQLRHSQRMEAIGQLAGGIAHDFNNVLGTIVGNTALARELMPPSPAAAECLEQVMQASHRAKELVRQILAFSRREEFQRQEIDTESLLRETVILLRASLPARIEVTASLHPPVPALTGNHSLLQQVLINLVTNASQAIGSRSGHETIDASRQVVTEERGAQDRKFRPGSYVRLIVSDDGPGIPPEALDRIFEPFFTTKPVGEGTGLGLSVVHGIVSSHGGFIQVENRPGTGAAFHVYLPAALVSAVSGTKKPIQPLPFPTGGCERILLIDDEPSLLSVGRRVLQSCGYEVQDCLRPAEALEIFRRSPASFDLIVTDYSMPGLSGVELARQIRLLRPLIPMVICTGYGADLSDEQARGMGFYAVLQKPVTMELLQRTVRSALDVRSGVGP